MKTAYPGAYTDLATAAQPVNDYVAAVEAAFPGQYELGSSKRPDSYPDHPSGYAVDLMTDDPAAHAQLAEWTIGRYAVVSIITRGRRYTPVTGWAIYRGSNPHNDHVHVWLAGNTATDSFPLAGETRAGHAAYYGPISGPAWSVGGARPADRPAIRRIQAVLRAAGYDLGRGGIDGIYGLATARAVRSYQTAHGLTSDGLVGPATWGVMSR